MKWIYRWVYVSKYMLPDASLEIFDGIGLDGWQSAGVTQDAVNGNRYLFMKEVSANE